MRNIKARIEKLERRTPKDILIILLTDVGDKVPLSPEEESVLKIEQNRRLQESKDTQLVMKWSRKEAQRLMASGEGTP